MSNTEIATVESAGFLTETVNLNDLFSEEMEGLRPSFDKISICDFDLIHILKSKRHIHFLWNIISLYAIKTN